MKMMNLQYFCIFYVYLMASYIFKVFFCENLTKPCRHARTLQLFNQQSLASIKNKNPTILTKRPPVASTVPSGTQRHHWGIGKPGYTFGSSIQAHAISPPSCHHARTFQLVSQQNFPTGQPAKLGKY